MTFSDGFMFAAGKAAFGVAAGAGIIAMLFCFAFFYTECRRLRKWQEKYGNKARKTETEAPQRDERAGKR